MGKRKITTLFAIAAAVLMAMPMQAQDLTKIVKPKATLQKAVKNLTPEQIREMKVAMAKENKEAVVQQNVVAPQQKPALTDCPVVSKAEGTLITPLWANERAEQSGRLTTPLYAATADANGIITAPDEGEHKYYLRDGYAYYYNQGVYLTNQTGDVEIVECEDGTVYVKNLVSEYKTGAWVKGTIEGNTLTIPVDQPVSYSSTYMTTLSIYWGIYTPGVGFDKDLSKENITFTIDGDVIKMEGTDDYNFVGVFWDDDDSFTGYGDYNTVWTLDTEYNPSLYELVTLPAGVETENWYLIGYTYSSGAYNMYKARPEVAFDGDDVYVKGIFTDFPESWVKGTIDGNTVTFKNLQYLGAYSSYDIWATGVEVVDGEYLTADFTMTYYPEEKVLEADDVIFANADMYEIYYLTQIVSLYISAENPIEAISELPYTNGFETESEQQAFEIIDNNDDGYTWTISDGVAIYSYNTYSDADDWLISPAISLTAGEKYQMSIDVKAASTTYPERVEVLFGDDPLNMSKVIIPPTDITWADGFVTLTSDAIAISADGEFYFGIHAISDADMFRLSVDNFEVGKALTEASPAAPRLAVQPDPYGAGKSVVTVTAPTRSLGGEVLTSYLSKMVVLRDGEVVKTYTNVRPGDTMVFVDWLELGEEIGKHSFQAIAYDENGDRGLKGEVISKVVGLDVPNMVEGLTANETSTGVNLSWDPVTTGFNGGVVVPSDIEYEVWTGHEEVYFIFTYYVLDEKIATTKDTSISVDLDYDGDQELQNLFVVAKNEAGRVEDDYATGVTFFAGNPYQLPFEESFAGAQLTYPTWLIAESSYYGYADITEDESSDNDGGSLYLEGSYDGDYIAVTPGKVAMVQGNPTLVFDVMGDGTENKFYVKVQNSDGKITKMCEEYPIDEWTTVSIPLAELGEQNFIKPMFGAEFTEEGAIYIDNIMILDLLEYNLEVKVEAPKAVNAGETANVKVLVRNMGDRNAESFTVKLYADDELLFNMVEDDANLKSFETAEWEVPFETTIFDDQKDVTLRAEVDFDLDLDEDNNTAETIITVNESKVAQPQNVVAEKNGKEVKLTWDAPGSSIETVFEDFEEGFGGWKAIDADGDGFNWNHHINTGSGNYATHSGDGSINSASWDSNAGALKPDNWIVSPLAILDGEFKFWACGQDADWAEEHFAVFVSTTSDSDPAAFTQVGEEFIATGNMTEYTVDLSQFEGKEGYIAIRHFNVTDMFVLVVDDITYTKSSGSVAAYNIYVDGEDGVYESTTATTFIIENIGKAKWVAVSAVLSTGKESKPVVVDLSGANQEITAIEQLTGNNKPVDIYSLDGKLVRQQATSLNGLKGAYIINGTKVMVK